MPCDHSHYITTRMDERPTFAEIFAWAGIAAFIGGTTVAVLIVLASAAGDIAILLVLFLAICFGIIAAVFTAFPLGVLIGYPTARVLGWSFFHASLVGLVCSLSLLYLWSGADLQYVFGPDGSNWMALAFIGVGPLSGWAAYQIGAGSFAWTK